MAIDLNTLNQQSFHSTYCVDRLCNQIFNRNPRYKGRLEAIGSEAEGIHVNTSDYDFLLVSKAPTIQMEKLEIKPAEMPSVRADEMSENNLLKSYFKVSFKGEIPEEWKDCTETGSKSLNARLVQRSLAKTISDLVNPNEEPNWNGQPTSFTVLNKRSNTVTSNGPAASFVVIDRTNSKPKKMNIDMTFAIPLHLTDSTDFWPLDGQFPGVELTDHVKAGQPIKAVHLVPAGDFWRLSFVLEERERMKKLLLDENKHTCMVALKAMRNSVSLTNDDESPLLSSYPLKWSFMMETCGTEDDTWQEDTLGWHTFHILVRVLRCGGTGSMSSFFLKGDPVLRDSDRSYLESRRIIKLSNEEVDKFAYISVFCLILLGISRLSSGCYHLYVDYPFGKDFGVKNPRLKCAEANTYSALVPILTVLIVCVIVLLVKAFRVFALLGKALQIFLVYLILEAFLLRPIFSLVIEYSDDYACTLKRLEGFSNIVVIMIIPSVLACRSFYRRCQGG